MEKQGAPKKTSGRSYSLERPVARHFVCQVLEHAACRAQTLQNKSGQFFLPGRNCHATGKNYYSAGSAKSGPERC